MRLKLTRNPLESPEERESTDVQIRRLTHPSEILLYLENDRTYAASGIAHLEPELLDVSKWFLAADDDSLSLCLISKSAYGGSPNYLLTIGNSPTLDYLLESQPLPGRALITCKPQHLDIIKRYYELTWYRLVKRMVATRESFTAATEEATRLRPPHARALNQLYALHTGHYFSSHQIRHGVYYGVWRDDKLVAVAGTHLISQSYGVAHVGNVLTHAAYRNQGLATICTSAVTDRLLDFCTEVVLDVEPQNLPAARAYASLGYQHDCHVIEALGRRKCFVDDIIPKLCKKLGLGTKYKERMELYGEGQNL
ncbi:MAG: GNAT family N-acetyltransferase [Dehalococcoidia bacterium]